MINICKYVSFQVLEIINLRKLVPFFILITPSTGKDSPLPNKTSNFRIEKKEDTSIISSYICWHKIKELIELFSENCTSFYNWGGGEYWFWVPPPSRNPTYVPAWVSLYLYWSRLFCVGFLVESEMDIGVRVSWWSGGFDNYVPIA